MKYLANFAVNYQYDPCNRLTNLQTVGFGLPDSSFSFDSNGDLIRIEKGYTTTLLTPDANRRITGIRANNSAGAFHQRTITRNGLGYKTAQTIQPGYDPVLPSLRHYEQHNSDNRITHISRLNQPGAPEPWADISPIYDANGNLIRSIASTTGSVSQTTYTWDALNHLKSITGATAYQQLAYNASGNLTRYIHNGDTCHLVRDWADPLKRPLMEVKLDGSPTCAWIWANDLLIAQVDDIGTIHYAHTDELGNLIALTDSAGQVTDQFACDPYGQLISRTGTTDIPFTWLANYGVVDLGDDLYATLHRTYHAGYMRFISRDPIGLEGGLNLFAYAEGNPLFYLDYLGLCKTESVTDWTLRNLGGMANQLESWASQNRAAESAYAASYDQYTRDHPTMSQIGDNINSTVSEVLTVGAVMGLAKATISSPQVASVPIAKSVPTYTQMEFPFAKGASVQTPGVTVAGESFVRVGASPQNLKFSFGSSGGVQPGTYAFPESTFNAIGSSPKALKNFGDLPGAVPQYYRTIQPPAGTAIQRGIVPGGQYGGVGGVGEVIFPKGF